MKNHEEMTASVFCRMAEYEAEQKKRAGIRNRLLALGACCALVLLVSISAGQSGLFPTVPGQTAITDPAVHTDGEGTQSPVSANTTDPSTVPPAQIPTNDCIQMLCTLNLNPMPGDTAGSKRYFDPALYTEEIQEPEDMAAYLGFDLRKLELGYVCTPSTNCPLIRDLEGNIVYDTMGYWYEEIDLTVSLSKIGSPYDCVYHEAEDDPSQFYLSSGETVEAFLYTYNGSRYVADFELGDIRFRVEGDACGSETDFAMLVRQIMEFVAASSLHRR